MTEPIQVTDEMRQAVHEDDCVRDGHTLDSQGMIVLNDKSTKVGTLRADIGGPDDASFPHVRCVHCGVVWLVWPEPLADYDTAVMAVKGLMRNPDDLKPRAIPNRLNASHTH